MGVTLNAMFSLIQFSVLILCLPIKFASGETKTLTVINNCNYSVWPGIRTLTGKAVSEIDSGFALLEGDSRAIQVQPKWSGQVVGRTLCSTDESTGNFSCQAGDCKTGKIQCDGTSSFDSLATLAELTFEPDKDDAYDVNVFKGYNIPLMIAPHVDNGVSCEATGCVFDISASCPADFRVLSNIGSNSMVACSRPCASVSTDQYCCDNIRNDGKVVPVTCDGSRVSIYNIMFCPPSALSRLFSPVAQASQPPAAISAPPSSSLEPGLSPASNLTTKPVLRPPSIPIVVRSSKTSNKKRLRKSLIISFPTVTLVILLLVLLGVSIYTRRRKKKTTLSNVDSHKPGKVGDSLQIDLDTIRLATRNFAVENKLGEGGFGEVYRGETESGQAIAVKRLSKNSGQGIAEFETEIVLVAGLQHKNLVKLLGYCAAPNESLLVYEFLRNSSLDKFLFDPAKKASLDWNTRFRIIVGIARGLLYLHEDSRIKVVHRDLKSSNILLDEAMNPKIADFGLARLFGVDQTQDDTKRIVGTYGYMAPEYAITGHYSVKSDVYSFGVIVLEIVSGQRSRLFGRVQLDEALLHRAWRLWNEDVAMNLVDTELGDNFPKDQLLKCIQIGLLCIQEDAVDRPRMTSIVPVLSGQAISLPAPKPPLFFARATNSEAQYTLDGHASQYIYTGAETMITGVYSRD